MTLILDICELLDAMNATDGFESFSEDWLGASADYLDRLVTLPDAPDVEHLTTLAFRLDALSRMFAEDAPPNSSPQRCANILGTEARKVFGLITGV